MRLRKSGTKSSSKQAAKTLRSKAGPSVSQPPESTPEAKGPRRPQVTPRLRPSLKKTLEVEAQARGLTALALCLLGLQQLGLPVTDADLADGRKSDARAKQSINQGGRSQNWHWGARSNSSSNGTRKSGRHPANPQRLIELLQSVSGQHDAAAAGALNIFIVNGWCGGV